MSESLKKLRVEVDTFNKAKAEFIASMRDKLNGVLKEIMNEFDGKLEYFRWEQFAPYFNDGEPCVFRYRGLEFAPAGMEFGRSECEVDYVLEEYENEPYIPLLKELNSVLSDLEDVLEDLYGSDARVIVWKDCVEVEEFLDHD